MAWEEPYGQGGCNSHGGELAVALAVRSGNKSQGARVVCCPHGGGWCLPPVLTGTAGAAVQCGAQSKQPGQRPRAQRRLGLAAATALDAVIRG